MDLITVLQNLFPTLVGACAGGFAAYVAIRSDLAHQAATIAILQESVQRAHTRLDEHINRHIKP